MGFPAGTRPRPRAPPPGYPGRLPTALTCEGCEHLGRARSATGHAGARPPEEHLLSSGLSFLFIKGGSELSASQQQHFLEFLQGMTNGQRAF